MSETRIALRKPFAPSDVKQREGAGRMKLDYVAGETVIGRLLDATENTGGYAWQGQVVHIEHGKETDRNDNPLWTVVVSGHLLIDGSGGFGIGSMSNADLDMAAKSANTEAIKNAAKNGFGVGLELWDKEYRAALKQRRLAAEGDEKALKALVFDLAKDKLGTRPTAKATAELFGTTVGGLSDAATLTTILEAEEVI